MGLVLTMDIYRQEWMGIDKGRGDLDEVYKFKRYRIQRHEDTIYDTWEDCQC